MSAHGSNADIQGTLVVVGDRAQISSLQSKASITDATVKTVYLPAPVGPSAIAACAPRVVACFHSAVDSGVLAFARAVKSDPSLVHTLFLAIVPQGCVLTNGEVREAGIWHVITEQQALQALSNLAPVAIKLQWKQYESGDPQFVDRSKKPAEFWTAKYEASITRIPYPEMAPRTQSACSRPPDAIPDSGATPRSVMQSGGGSGLCHNCGRWKPEPEDRHCAWCSVPLIVPGVDATELCFTAESQHCERVLTLRNDGTNDLYATLELRGSDDALSRFSLWPEQPDNLYEIPAGGHEAITIAFDGQGVDPATDYSVALGIDTNAPLETMNVNLRVERPPIAFLLPPANPRPVFVCGDRAAFPITIRNTGGGILEVDRVQLEEPKQAAAGVACSVEIPKGSEATIDLPLDLERLKAGDFIARGFVIFENHAQAEFTRSLTVERPARIRLAPASISSDLYHIARADRQALEVLNVGDETLDIQRITPSVAWAHPLCKNNQVGPRQRTFIDVFLDGSDLPVGNHTGHLEIVSNSHGGSVRVPLSVRVHDLQILPDPIGVDFGTSLSCVATVRDGDPVLVDINPDDDGNSVEGHGLPSVVFFEENLFPIVGNAAKKRAEIDPSASVQSVKRLLGGSRNLKIRGREFTPSEISTEIFRALLGAVERSVIDRGSPRNAVLTVPADISDEQIREVLKAAAAAGLDIDHGNSQEYVLDEPSAAALYYLWKSRKHDGHIREELVFIYDFGAGTLDCSLVLILRETDATKIAVLATTGDRRFGGDDVDLAIAQHVARRLQDSKGFDAMPILCSTATLNALKGHEYTRAIAARVRFCRLAERLKIELSASDEAAIEFPISPAESEVAKLTSEELNEIMRPFLSRSDAVVAGCCKQAGVTPDRVHTVLHTGRGSAISVLRTRVNALFPSSSDRSGFIEAKQCVAMGAAWWAHIKNLPGIDIKFEGLSPKIPHSIGYRAFENFGSVFKPIFEAGQCYPAEKRLAFPCLAGHKFELNIVEKRFGLDERTRSRGTVRLPASNVDQNHTCVFRLTPQRTLEVLLAGHKLEIDPHEDEDTSAS